MLEQTVLNKENKEVKKVKLKETIFGVPFRQQLLFDCVQAYLANKRLGTQKAKTRGEVKGTTAKMYKQKGTGRARHGDAKANIFVGGGVAFPPTPRSWHVAVPQKMRRQALMAILSRRCKEGNLLVVDQFKVDAIKTKQVAQQLNKWNLNEGLVVIDRPDEKLWKSLRNIPRLRLVTADDVNALDILSFGKLVLTEKALQQLEKRLS